MPSISDSHHSSHGASPSSAVASRRTSSQTSETDIDCPAHPEPADDWPVSGTLPDEQRRCPHSDTTVLTKPPPVTPERPIGASLERLHDALPDCRIGGTPLDYGPHVL